MEDETDVSRWRSDARRLSSAARELENAGAVDEAFVLWAQVAQACRMAGQADRAIRALRRRCELAPDSPEAHVTYAQALAEAEQPSDAVQAFSLAATLLKRAGRHEEYIRVAERILYHTPTDVSLAQSVAEAYLDQGDPRRALRKLQLCYFRAPQSVSILELMVRALRMQGRFTDARALESEIERLQTRRQRGGE